MLNARYGKMFKPPQPASLHTDKPGLNQVAGEHKHNHWLDTTPHFTQRLFCGPSRAAKGPARHGAAYICASAYSSQEVDA